MTTGTISTTIRGNLQTSSFLEFFFAADLVPVGATVQSVQLYSAEKDITTTLTGDAFVFDGDGNLIAGTITGITSAGPRGAFVELTGAQFDAVDFAQAASGLADGDPTNLSLLLNDYGVNFDASGSRGGLEGSFLDFLGDRMITGTRYCDFLVADTAAPTTLDGGGGDDLIFVGGAEVATSGRFLGGAGDDAFIILGVGNSQFLGGHGDDVMVGGFLVTGNDLRGGAGNDMIRILQTGETAIRNVIRGGAGDDLLWAEKSLAEDDVRTMLIGGTGADQFVFDTRDFTPILNVRDFDVAEDTLVMAASSFADGTTAQDIVNSFGHLNGQGFVYLEVVLDMFAGIVGMVTLRGVTSLEDAASAIQLVDDAYLDGLFV
jgi:hypothetical protein